MKAPSPIRNAIYYAVKPFVPLSLRRGVRRVFAERKRQKVGAYWPVQLGSEKRPQKWPGWPNGKKFAFLLTHDVEGQGGVDKCRDLMAVEEKYGFRSSFNFIPEGEYRVTAELRAEVVRRGFEVGVHDLNHDGKLYQSRRAFARKAARINDYLKEWGACGFRAGFMFHNLEWLQDLNVTYDASTFDVDPFEPQPDGVGTIFPFWRNGPRGRGYVELPYTLPQDSTVFLIFGENTPDMWLRKLDWVAEHGGMALVNVHPDYINFSGTEDRAFTFPVSFYEALLQHVRDKYGDSCWHVLPKELASWLVKTDMVAEERRRYAAAEAPAADSESRRPLRGRAAVVLYSHYSADPRPRRETEALVAAGMQADVIALQDHSGQPPVEMVNGVTVHHVGLQRRRGGQMTYFFQYGYFFFGAFWRLTLWSLRQRIEVVHVHNMPDFLVFTAIVPRLQGAKIILDLHDPMPELFCSIYHTSQKKSFWFRFLCAIERWSIGMADVVLTPNEAFRRIFGQRSGSPEKIHIVMNSPDPALFDPVKTKDAPKEPPRKRRFTVMYHGLLVERHGLDLAIDALARIRARCPGLGLDIYGGHTDYVDQILGQIEKLGLKDVAAYHNFKRLPEIVKIIGDIDLGIVPNRMTDFTAINFPTRIFEYLAMNKPVMAPRTQGIVDYFAEDELLFFEPGNVDDIAEKLAWAYSHPVELQALMERGREVYRRNAWPLQKSRLLSVVQSLLPADSPDQRLEVNLDKGQPLVEASLKSD